MGPKWTPGGPRGGPNRALKSQPFWALFLMPLEDPCPPPWSPENHENQVENWHRNRNLLRYGFIPHLHHSGEAFWLRFWTRMGSILDPRARSAYFIVAAARISGFQGCPKRSPKRQKTPSPGNPAPRASWKAPRHDFSTILTSFWPLQIVLKKHRQSMNT